MLCVECRQPALYVGPDAQVFCSDACSGIAVPAPPGAAFARALLAGGSPTSPSVADVARAVPEWARNAGTSNAVLQDFHGALYARIREGGGRNASLGKVGDPGRRHLDEAQVRTAYLAMLRGWVQRPVEQRADYAVAFARQIRDALEAMHRPQDVWVALALLDVSEIAPESTISGVTPTEIAMALEGSAEAPHIGITIEELRQRVKTAEEDVAQETKRWKTLQADGAPQKEIDTAQASKENAQARFRRARQAVIRRDPSADDEFASAKRKTGLATLAERVETLERERHAADLAAKAASDDADRKGLQAAERRLAARVAEARHRLRVAAAEASAAPENAEERAARQRL